MTHLEAALEYAARGWHVFPCWGTTADLCDCRQDDCPSPGKHPLGDLAPHGLTDATDSASRIRDWWGMVPNANVAIATGDRSGLLVLDIDPPDGIQTLGALEGRFGPLPATLEAVTGRSGRHLVFESPGNVRSRNGFADGVDLKADGGYIVAPPSRHISGNRYHWTDFDADVVGLPLRWIDALSSQQPATIQKATSSAIPEGRRNVTLASMAGSMRRRGMEPEAIEAALLVQNRRCTPPLPERDCRAIARSIGRYEPTAPAGEGDGALATPLEPRILDLESIWRDPAPETPWIIQGWLAEEDRVFLLGKAKTGKSVLLLDLAFALATGHAWLGMDVKPRRVLYFDEEQTGILARQRLKRAMIGRDLQDPRDLPLRYLHRNHLNLDNGPAAELFFRQVREFEPDVICIDSLKRIHGRDENESRGMGLFLSDILDPLLRDTRIGLVCIHHPRKGEIREEDILEALRGSSAIGDYADCVWGYLMAGEQRKLVNAATRWDEAGQPRIVSLRTPNGGVTLAGSDQGDEVERWLIDVLSEGGPNGLMRQEILAVWCDQHGLPHKSETASKAIQRGLSQLYEASLACKDRDGNGMRYWLSRFAPETATRTRIRR